MLALPVSPNQSGESRGSVASFFAKSARKDAPLPKVFDLEITKMQFGHAHDQWQPFNSSFGGEAASNRSIRASRRPSERRLRRIAKRQADPSWGKDYVPAILAVQGEAPSISHALTIIPEKLDRREVHLLSLAECSAAILGLYHPNSIALQEQRAFSIRQCLHPLHNFASASPVGLKPLKGIVDVADRLGYLDVLPKVKIADACAVGGYRWVVFPFIGDLLWVMRTNDGHHYCINWSVKDSEEAFKRPLESKRFVTPKGQVTEGILVRHELERRYYQDAGIRTVFLAADAIHPHVRANLRLLFLHHNRQVFLPQEERDELTERFRSCLESGVPAFDLIVRLTGSGKYSLDDCRNILFQAIWFRRLKVDLFEPILINRPLNPEMRDVIEVYAEWFKEVVPC